MRILSLRLKNLNSLAGTWRIDLTHPTLATDGLLVITGPTGAGKSTILDALCLALYGRTPRLGNVSKSENEIMTRHTGDCFAEATFAVESGTYRCQWSQRRARRQPGGALQQPQQELSDTRTGTPMETSIHGVSKRVEQLTGMNFEQFSRAMLLAQGAFAAFLQASPGERSPLLEQITGTEIYSRISVEVHRRWGEEKARETKLSAALDNTHRMPPEEEEACGKELARLGLEERDGAKKIAECRRSLDGLETTARLEDALKKLQAEKEAFKVRLEAFAPERKRLDAALRALELEGTFAALASLRDAEKKDARALSEALQLLPSLEKEEQEASLASQKRNSALNAAKALLLDRLPTLRKTRELDVRLSENARALAEAKDKVTRRKQELAALALQERTDENEHKRTETNLEKVRAQRNANAADAALAEQLSGVKASAAALLKASSRRASSAERLKTCEQKLEAAKRLSETAATILREANNQKMKADTALNSLQERLEETLGEKTQDVWQEERMRLAGKKSTLVKMTGDNRLLLKNAARADELSKRMSAIANEAAQLERNLSDAAKLKESVAREESLLVDEMALRARIRDLEEERRTLRDGEACPLCGAKEHPFAAGNVPQADEIRLNLNSARKRLEKARTAMEQLQRVVAEKKSEKAALTGTLQTLEQEKNEARARLDETDPSISRRADRTEYLATLMNETDAALEAVEKVLNAAVLLATRLREKEKEREHANEKALFAERKAVESQHASEEAQNALNEARREATDCKAEELEAKKAFFETVRPFGVNETETAHPESLLQSLTTRRDAFKKLEEEIAALTTCLQDIEAHSKQRSALSERHKEELAAEQDGLGAATEERRLLEQERKALLCDLSPDAEEDRLNNAIAAATQDAECGEKALETVCASRKALQNRIQTLEQAREERKSTLGTREDSFCKMRMRAGFTAETDFTSSRLSEEDRLKLSEAKESLDQQGAKFVCAEQELLGNLEIQRGLNMSEDTPQTLRDRLSALLSAQQERQKNTGALEERLKVNENTKAALHKQEERLALQKNVTARWNALHDLIGSADGKKFRDLAQGLTFERVVAQANRQLARMTDRYLLLRDKDQPLELRVIDAYQSDEVRSTKNLSGGEKFLVSLALALGLSGMAGRSVRVDSLFLDEGFGTLDEETLETALDALTSLRNDGKQICIISHVQALKERIAAQIRVEPSSGGRSRIFGPGCVKENDMPNTSASALQ